MIKKFLSYLKDFIFHNFCDIKFKFAKFKINGI